MARAALDLSIDQLAEKVGLSHVDITRIEDGTDGDGASRDRLKAALEEAGIEWIEEDGVRYRGSPGAPGIPVENLTTDNDDGVS
jgi:transcriptional regulator with XRE-family HTH domain